MVAFGITALYVFIPLGIVIFVETSSIVRRVRPIILCYIVGILIGNSGLLPEGSFPVLDAISTVTVALSLPLMLISLDLSRWRELTGRAGLSMAFAFIAIMSSSAVCFLLFGSGIDESAKIAGLLVGVYTGGTPNMAALQRALQVNTESYLAVHTADVLVGGVYLLFLLTLGRRIIRKILPRYRDSYTEGREIEPLSLKALRTMITDRAGGSVMASLGVALGIVVLGGAFSLFFPGEASTVAAILGITSIAIGASFIPRIRELPHSFKIGEYVILVFCAAVGSMADFTKLLTTIPSVLGYVTAALGISILIHLLLCRIFGVDADTMMITSTSAIYSPPFVSAVAISLNNRNLIFPGITTGIIGYAAGNYLGVLLARLLTLV
ncbi:DUF819 family protein [Marispirochaeta aestuarii]|uniref:DUF819 family protein n=1 Tax=Marispirochaeta aestuarii TaxID=1963862 RepID=UPI0029C7F908|nr:DUF819 family protein [Marispirochaeta aestuarii]